MDDPARWTKFRDSSQCQGCRAHCCTLGAEVSWMDLIRLGWVSEEEAASSSQTALRRLQRAKRCDLDVGALSAGTVAKLAGKKNRDCVLLDSRTRLCRDYEHRPAVCRSFPLKVGARPGYCPRNVPAPKSSLKC